MCNLIAKTGTFYAEKTILSLQELSAKKTLSRGNSGTSVKGQARVVKIQPQELDETQEEKFPLWNLAFELEQTEWSRPFYLLSKRYMQVYSVRVEATSSDQDFGIGYINVLNINSLNKSINIIQYYLIGNLHCDD